MAKITLRNSRPNDYWLRRLAKEGDKLEQMSIDEADAWLAQYYRELSVRVLDKIENYYLRLQNDKPGDAVLSHSFSFERYVSLFNEIQVELNRLGINEIKGLEKRFVKLYKDNSAFLENYLGLPHHKLNNEAVIQAVNRVWCQDNKTWSDRVWEHTNQLKQSLTTTLGDAISAGSSVDDLSSQLMNEFNVNWYDARRIARTEMSHIYNQSSVDRYKEAGIKEYEWLADPNKAKVCKLCEENNGKRFPIDDLENIPPAGSHPNCLCSVIPVLE